MEHTNQSSPLTIICMIVPRTVETYTTEIEAKGRVSVPLKD